MGSIGYNGAFIPLRFAAMTPPTKPQPATDPFATEDLPRDTNEAKATDSTPRDGVGSGGNVPRCEGSEPVPGYKLVKRLGSGGFGEVWQAIGPGGFAVALKFIDMGRATGKFELRSLEVMKEVRHAHLLTMFGSWQVGDFLIIAMEMADQTLLDRFKTYKTKGAAGIPQAELLGYLEEAAKGLDHLNQDRRIQHRDIKPHNLLLVGGTVKVADFGLAKLLDASHGSHSGSGQSFPYAAPEFFRDQTAMTSDQYSLAITYCHLRGGRVPFNGTQAQIINGHLRLVPDLSMLPPEERAIVTKALAKNPSERWATCRDFVTALTRRSVPDQITAPHVPPPFPAVGRSGPQPSLPPTPAPARSPRPSNPNLPAPPPLRRRLPRHAQNKGFNTILIVFGAILVVILGIVGFIALVK